MAAQHRLRRRQGPRDAQVRAAARRFGRTGGYTYFVPDVAYHIHKFERGFHKVINVQGSDHHGTIARVRAGLQAARLGIPAGFPDYLLHKMVTVMRGGQEVKISKRAGSYVTLRDLIDWTSRDAVRFFLISRKADTEFVFDIDLALKANDENPVFYVQYAHARICSVLAQWPQGLESADLSLLTAPTELALMLKLADYPEHAGARRCRTGAARPGLLPARPGGRVPQLLRGRALPGRRCGAGARAHGAAGRRRARCCAMRCGCWA